jgi:hypothetical protein
MSKDWDKLYRYSPSKKYRFFFYDPIDAKIIFFENESDRDEYAKELIHDYYCDDEDGWSSEIIYICAGKVTHVCKQINTKIKPLIEELDEDGFDEDGTYWNDFDTICDYELKELE